VQAFRFLVFFNLAITLDNGLQGLLVLVALCGEGLAKKIHVRLMAMTVRDLSKGISEGSFGTVEQAQIYR
jgi:hypothetical protein